ncbi:hypothetical protein H6G80_34950 [Nostoc sp. FACHB-87]|uniref:hypothetical protein n=1 Tax=Nostocaceae TaxID=1162 RepID=UPI001688A4E4|nr:MULTISPECIES: hypothetical protein [Nostocaceae]MBD2302226.1 hypothetical protein [Nostoc sp. FACHB-190]MBD2459223.1 hypothetical protein [Nostoc sp. FACHB-87]MBD2480230.1 hypothetical protein [Anabaena sp. FACHB-83]
MKNQIKLVFQNPKTSVIPSTLSKLSLVELDNVSGGFPPNAYDWCQPTRTWVLPGTCRKGGPGGWEAP